MEPQGQVIRDRYAVEALLGEGGDALVYRATDRHLRRTVAVKLLRPELRADPTFVARFEREAQSAGRLNHPYIVPVYDYGEGLGTYFLVMEYLAGGDLRARLRPGAPLAPDLAARLGAQVAEALGAAHALGIVHRDVKPANVLLAEDGSARVTDFGIAKMLAVPQLTATAAILGTPHYLAPEQATGDAVTPASNVYSLGVVLYEMLAGRRPFEGESFVRVAMQHLNTVPPALTDVNRAVPPALAAIVARALAKDPSARFADGAALAAALRDWAAPGGVRAASAPSARRWAPASNPLPTPAPATAEHAPAAGPGSGAAAPADARPAASPLPTNIRRPARAADEPIAAAASLPGALHARRQPGRRDPYATTATIAVAAALVLVGLAGARSIVGTWREQPAAMAEAPPPEPAPPPPPVAPAVAPASAPPPAASLAAPPEPPVVSTLPTIALEPVEAPSTEPTAAPPAPVAAAPEPAAAPAPPPSAPPVLAAAPPPAVAVLTGAASTAPAAEPPPVRVVAVSAPERAPEPAPPAAAPPAPEPEPELAAVAPEPPAAAAPAARPAAVAPRAAQPSAAQPPAGQMPLPPVPVILPPYPVPWGPFPMGPVPPMLGPPGMVPPYMRPPGPLPPMAVPYATPQTPQQGQRRR